MSMIPSTVTGSLLDDDDDQKTITNVPVGDGTTTNSVTTPNAPTTPADVPAPTTSPALISRRKSIVGINVDAVMMEAKQKSGCFDEVPEVAAIRSELKEPEIVAQQSQPEDNKTEENRSDLKEDHHEGAVTTNETDEERQSAPDAEQTQQIEMPLQTSGLLDISRTIDEMFA
ncbi:hypothetical protein HK102_010634, partial [Quaeritorhiza haematococci]